MISAADMQVQVSSFLSLLYDVLHAWVHAFFCDELRSLGGPAKINFSLPYYYIIIFITVSLI